jgi:hypothetical protein
MREGRWLLWSCAALLLLMAGRQARSQAAPAGITFEYDIPGESPVHYRIYLTEAGVGKYQAAGGSGVGASEIDFHLPASVAADWFAEARTLHCFNGNFEAKRKVAFSGHKTLRYAGPDCTGETTLNYTEDKRMVAMVDNFLGIGATLQVGQRFESDARFHRMGLDEDMVTYKESLKNHQASYPVIIAPILQQLVDDPEVMTRVQRDASAILHSTSSE